MAEVLTRAACFIGIILMGWLLRQVGFFKKEDFHVLSRIVIRITLTAVIVKNLDGQTLSWAMLLPVGLGFGFCSMLMFVGWFLARKGTKLDQAFGLLNTQGCNIGCFVLPFVQTFLGPSAVVTVSLFDMGNSFNSLGLSYALGGMVAEGRRFSLKQMIRRMLGSAPLVAYLCMLTLAALHLRLPNMVRQYVTLIGDANAFLAMLMVGVGFQLSLEPAKLGTMARILVPRFGLGILCAALSFFLLPLPLETRQALAILFLSPVSNSAVAFTAELKGDFGLSSAINSLSMLISIGLIVGALVVLL